MRFKNCKSGKWEQPVMKRYLLQCCDCGLVHRMQFRVVFDKKGNPHVQFRAWRHNKLTAEVRRKRK